MGTTWPLAGGRHLNPSTKTWPQPTACKLQFWNTSGQMAQQGRTTPVTAVIRDFLNPKLPLDVSLDTTLPTRGPRTKSTNQWAGTSLSCQEMCTGLTHTGADTKRKKLQSCILWNFVYLEPAGVWLLIMRGEYIVRKSLRGHFSKVEKLN